MIIENNWVIEFDKNETRNMQNTMKLLVNMCGKISDTNTETIIKNQTGFGLKEIEYTIDLLNIFTQKFGTD